ncbi:hypothetical protein BgiMline_017684 [Biomphalaria glabrata]|nr:hypothetical protein BgiMline_005319 [Biomphalaria glabrata]
MNRFIGFVIAVSYLTTVNAGTSDLGPVVATYTPACQLVVDYNSSEVLNLTVSCNYISIYAGYLYSVKLGFCTENEYNNLTVTVCGGNVTDTEVSPARTNFYAAVNNVSHSCQSNIYTCIKSSVIPIVMRQQEQFCSLMSLNVNGTTSELCLTTGDYNCTQDEFNQLKTAACSVNSTTVDQNFSRALLNTTSKCQSMISHCAGTSTEAWIDVLVQKYCDSLKINSDAGSAEECFKQDGACTSAEFDMLKLAACGQETTTSTVISPTSPRNTATNISVATIIFVLTLSAAFCGGFF